MYAFADAAGLNIIVDFKIIHCYFGVGGFVFSIVILEGTVFLSLSLPNCLEVDGWFASNCTNSKVAREVPS